MISHVCALLGKNLRRIFEKYLEGKKENEKMEGFDLTLRSIVMFKWKKIKDTYLRRYKD